MIALSNIVSKSVNLLVLKIIFGNNGDVLNAACFIEDHQKIVFFRIFSFTTNDSVNSSIVGAIL